MIRAAACAVGLALAAAPASGCPSATEALIFHSCWGEAHADLLLLPEDTPLPDPPAEGEGLRLIVTGAYTGRDTRGEGHPAPVGFYMRDGQLVNRNMSRMDGLLVVDPAEGRLSLHDRRAVRRNGETLNLRRLDPRHDFADGAAAEGLDVMQSHLLIIDGSLDVVEQADAPRFRRRILFTKDDEFGVYETPDAVTLHEAASRLADALAPDMALNLDMGSYDLCLLQRDGIERRCGVLGREAAEKLSNLLMLAVE